MSPTVIDLLWKQRGLRLIHHFGGWKSGWEDSREVEPGCVSIAEAALLPVTHHALLHDRQPCLACAQWEVRYSTVWAVIPPLLLTAANTERPKGVKTPWTSFTAILYRPWKISRLEPSERWMRAPFFPHLMSYSAVFPVGFDWKEQALTETPTDNLPQQTRKAIMQSH